MPSNKIIVVAILCVSIVLSTWLVMRQSKQPTITPQKNIVSVESYKSANIHTDDSWKKILITLDTNSQNSEIQSLFDRKDNVSAL